MKECVARIVELRQTEHPIISAAKAHKDFIVFIANMIKEIQQDYLRLFAA
jgi:hypothetical protein